MSGLDLRPHRYTIVAVITADRIEQARDLLGDFRDALEVRKPGFVDKRRALSFDGFFAIYEGGDN